MQIFVNEQLLDIQLENEKNFLDVYKAIENLIKKYNKNIIDFSINNMDITNQKLEDISIEEIDTVHFYVGDYNELVLYNVQTLDKYIDQLGNFFFVNEKLTSKDISEFQEGLLWINDMITSLSVKLQMNLRSLNIYLDGVYQNIAQNLLKLLELAKKIDQNNFQEWRKEIIESLRVLKAFSSQLYNQLLSQILKKEEILKALDEFLSEMETLSQKLVEINTNFQIGEDIKAFQELEEISEILEKYLFYFIVAKTRVDENDTLNSLVQKLRDILQELSKSLEQNDIVLLGDLLEYELTTFLNEIKEFIPILKSLLTK